MRWKCTATVIGSPRPTSQRLRYSLGIQCISEMRTSRLHWFSHEEGKGENGCMKCINHSEVVDGLPIRSPDMHQGSLKKKI